MERRQIFRAATKKENKYNCKHIQYKRIIICKNCNINICLDCAFFQVDIWDKGKYIHNELYCIKCSDKINFINSL